MTSQGALMFAVFTSSERARIARAELAFDTPDVELIATPDEVQRRAESSRPLIRKFGLLLAASLVVGFVIAGLATLALAALGTLSRPVPDAMLGAGIAVILAALLGGLAGGLAFTTRSQLELRRLCSLLEHGHGLLLFPANSGLVEHLRRFGAVQIGSL